MMDEFIIGDGLDGCLENHIRSREIDTPDEKNLTVCVTDLNLTMSFSELCISIEGVLASVEVISSVHVNLLDCLRFLLILPE